MLVCKSVLSNDITKLYDWVSAAAAVRDHDLRDKVQSPFFIHKIF